jgi:hypothetical protein
MNEPTSTPEALPVVHNPYLELAIQTLMDAASPPVLAVMQQMQDGGEDGGLIANAQCNAYMRLLCAAAAASITSLGSDRDKLVSGMQAYLSEGVDHLLANRALIEAAAGRVAS